MREKREEKKKNEQTRAKPPRWRRHDASISTNDCDN